MHGLRPTRVDPKDKRFEVRKLFGAVSFPDEYNADFGTSMPNQNDDNRPTACTSYTIAEIGTDQDGVEYSRDYQFMKTLQAMRVPPDTQGADARTAFKIPCTFGMLLKEHEPSEMSLNSQEWAAEQEHWDIHLDKEAEKNLKPAYLPIKKNPDYFDGIRHALMVGQKEHRTVGMATQWSADFRNTSRGKLTDSPRNLVWGHMYKVCGWKQIDGEPYLIVKSWQGKKYGDKGLCYMSRSLCNRLMGVWGAYAATIQDLPTNTVEELKSRQATFLEVAIAFAQNLIIKLKYGLAN